jgi:hypothetical protein
MLDPGSEILAELMHEPAMVALSLALLVASVAALVPLARRVRAAAWPGGAR